jgi:hypothetical protein
MHGGKRAPTNINSLDDGPNMGFTAGCEYVSIASTCNLYALYLEGKRIPLLFVIENQLVDQYRNHDNR